MPALIFVHFGVQETPGVPVVVQVSGGFFFLSVCLVSVVAAG